MNIRENLENLEVKNLSPYAAYSKDSKGRKKQRVSHKGTAMRL